MLGGHLDSWHSATGATDNAIGCAMMMEAARILKAIGVTAAADDPRRAVERRGAGAARIAGLREGALRIVREAEAGVRDARRLSQHRFGHRPRARRRRVRSAGGGQRILRQTLAPFEDLGVVGAVGDHQPRASAAPTARRSTTPGCPASASARIRSSTTRTRITRTSTTTSASSRATSRTSAIVIAATLYQLAMRDEMLPRFAPADMPPPVPRSSSAQCTRARGTQSAQGTQRTGKSRSWLCGSRALR